MGATFLTSFPKDPGCGLGGRFQIPSVREMSSPRNMLEFTGASPPFLPQSGGADFSGSSAERLTALQGLQERHDAHKIPP